MTLLLGAPSTIRLYHLRVPPINPLRVACTIWMSHIHLVPPHLYIRSYPRLLLTDYRTLLSCSNPVISHKTILFLRLHPLLSLFNLVPPNRCNNLTIPCLTPTNHSTPKQVQMIPPTSNIPHQKTPHRWISRHSCVHLTLAFSVAHHEIHCRI